MRARPCGPGLSTTSPRSAALHCGLSVSIPRAKNKTFAFVNILHTPQYIVNKRKRDCLFETVSFFFKVIWILFNGSVSKGMVTTLRKNSKGELCVYVT